MHAELVCTYRVQLTSEFTLDSAAEIVPYLSKLGISHIYLSPVLQAAKGSTHGYDVANAEKVSPALGGDEALGRLLDALRDHGMAAVIDIVPNHMSATSDNRWWWDILKFGQDSAFYEFFDVDWTPPDPELANKILLPVLGDHLGTVIERGELKLIEEDGELQFSYFDHRFPINPRTLPAGEPVIAELLDRQCYRLAFWRSAGEEINYRRFFDISTLVGLRIESPEVMEATHAKLIELSSTGPIDGFRIDHPDGLADPRAYFEDLHQRVPELWLIVEKILEPGERLRREWSVDGTTGYDFIQRCGGLLIAASGEKAISDFYAEFTNHTEPYGALVRNKKREVLELSFDGDLRRLVEVLRKICKKPEIRRDHSRRQLRYALSEIIAGFPVYRTYVNLARGEITDEDRELISHAITSAHRRSLPIDPSLIDLISDLLTGKITAGTTGEEFVTRFQQLTGPVMAKGVEDTTFYCYDRLLALNEVGCDPARFGVSPAAFHEISTALHKDWPRAMLATSTHDTKRSEEVRARISLLSEIPEIWADTVHRWSNHNLAAWEGREPDRNAEHLLYQTMVGAWPIETKRVTAYMEKACREAKTYTSWVDPDTAYEKRISDFVRSVLTDSTFIAQLEEFIQPLIVPGRWNSLAMTLIKLTSPGIPDVYQGCELWDNSLVDPDNRRVVNYSQRQKLLGDLDKGIDHIMENYDSGLPKIHLIREALTLRREIPKAFMAGESGEYMPIGISGHKLRHAIAYKRGNDIAAVAPLLPLGLKDGWGDTAIDFGSGNWLNVLDNSEHRGAVMLDTLLDRFPVALLKRISAS